VATLANSLTSRLAWVSLRAACRAAMRRVDLRVEGLEHVPVAGPAIIAARHYHHLYDGAALLAMAPRPLRIVVTLDWLENPIGQRVMREACRAAGWPIVPRSAVLDDQGIEQGRIPGAGRDLRAATRESVALLRAGRMLLVFPEGYPTIDPGYTPKTRDDEVLPFRPGFLRFAALAERDGRTRVPVIPAGLAYTRGERWRLTVRFGEPLCVDAAVELDEQAKTVGRRVRQLSGLAAGPDRGSAAPPAEWQPRHGA
jgi:1-acyl-sn-glycerol-3-phosphate acyltransferase